MYRFLREPRWAAATLLAVAAVVVCLLLGTWQLGRFEDRVDTHQAAENAPVTTDPIPVEEAFADGPDAPYVVPPEAGGNAATAVLATVTGRWDPANELLSPGRTVDGQEGFYVLTPLRTDDGRALVVARGFAPGAVDGPAADSVPPVTDDAPVTLTVRLERSEEGSTAGAAAGGLPDGQIAAVSTAAMINMLPYPLYDGWASATEPADGLLAVPYEAPAGTGLDLRAFQNLGYTAEWFIFAGFVVFMWFRVVRREGELRRDRELGIEPDPAPRPSRPHPDQPTPTPTR
ncbi:SURF1 family protein [Allostreptomyces psammosilenae]|uniref:SURF1-like protein n=1 Tax=Allostreptomyces psammosilenae TaxID=1892865 RepID=A0A852ZVC8_9ACTN|nr:SURF1 family protein [Allostreptomyces psammosilenae]NYI05587.1 cytochrome oxidase assembly protein ShyY1 [Allostreptomyces psammosilenae]